MQGKASDPAAWPPAFRIVGDDRPPMLHLGDGHYVRAREGADKKELAA
jgi:hypothetical protein